MTSRLVIGPLVKSRACLAPESRCYGVSLHVTQLDSLKYPSGAFYLLRSIHSVPS